MRKQDLSDTIAAISTPVGQGGIGIVRLSGKEALALADKVFISKDGKKPSSFKTYTVHYGWIKEAQSSKLKAQKLKLKTQNLKLKSQNLEIIDEVLVTVMRSPRSYTKEDIVEIGCHSGIVVLREILDLVLGAGARLAEPGEFTRRAFLNGRIDLSQAEAVLDIINAKTRLSLRSGIKHLRGALSGEIAKIRKELIDILAILEANIDFPEEDIGALNRNNLRRILGEISKKIDSLLSSFAQGKILREGISAVIVGRANVGKSSLLNALLKEERAIVTPIAGTTRDAIEEILDLKGIPLKIADTAGIIEPRDLIEKEAQRRTQSYFNKANLVLFVFDSNSPLTKEDKQLIKRSKNKQVIAVLNKCDLKQKIEEVQIRKQFSHIVKVSSLKLRGIKDLEEEIVNLIWQGKLESSGEIIVTNLRHAQSLRRAKEALARVQGSFKNNLSIELIAEDFKEALGYLDDISGNRFSEGLLEKIFSKFCIGK